MTRPYKVLAKSSDNDWLRKRQGLLTASSLSSVLGTCPWPKGKTSLQKRLAVIHEKRRDTPLQFKQTRPMWWGDASEYTNMQFFARTTGGTLVRQCRSLLQSTRLDRFGATLDGFCKPASIRGEPVDIAWSDGLHQFLFEFEHLDGLGLLEMKQTEIWYKKEWANGPPKHYWTQVQGQLFVTGLPWAVIACKIGAADMRAFVVYPDNDFFESELRPAVTDFWHDVNDTE